MRLIWAKHPGAPLLLGAFLALPFAGSAAAQESGEVEPVGFAAGSQEQPSAPAPAATSAVVRGQVTASYGDPLWGARVEVKGTKLSAKTDAKGEYTLSGVPPGEHTLTVRAEGFQSLSEKVMVSMETPAEASFVLDVDLMHVEEIVVTAQVPDRKIRSSTAISTASATEIQARAPRNTADLMRMVPGFYVESSGGEVGGNLFVRGLPADGSYRYVAMMEDGMPVYDSTELFFVNNDIFMRVDENIDRMEAVRGGSSALYGSNAPGGVVNFINKTGGDTLAGTLKVSTATSGLFRYDANINGPIGDDWRFSAGGFYRFDEGVRSPGFPASNGGQVKANLTRLIDTGKVTGHARLSFKYLDDRNTFFLPVPFSGRFDGSGRLTGHDFVAGFPVDGTLTSREGVDARVPLPQGGSLILPLDDGQRQRGTSAAADLRFYFPEAHWEVRNTTRAMQMDHSWNAMLPFELMDADTWARRVVGQSTPYRIVCTNLPGAPALGSDGCPTSNNLVALGGQWLVNKPMSNVSNQLKLTKWAEMGSTRHTIVGGLYFGHYTADNTWYFNDIVTDVRNRPHFLDLQELDGVGNVVRNVTEHGFRGYLSNYVNGTANATLIAAFAGDEIEINDQLRVDLAGRLERDLYQQNVEVTRQLDLGDPSTSADDNVTAGTGSFRRVNVGFTDWALSAGANYSLAEATSLYARATRGYKMPLLDQYLFATDAADPTFPRTPETLWQAEAGIKMSGKAYALAAVAYWLQLENFPSQDAQVDPVTGETRFVTVYAGRARTLGLEVEAVAQPLDFLRLQGALTVQDPRYTLFNEGSTDFSGKRIRRIPQVIAELTGTLRFGDATVGLNWTYVGHRFSNNANTVDLPGFSQLNAVASYTMDRFTVDLQVHNALDDFGLTEGNPRIDESLGAASDIFLARPVLPRRFTLSLTARL
jgi:outer membrane receptor protein involved in Fe transport